ncbi:peptidase [Paenibacillus sp. 2TAB19]|uniref:peptidase n=1 Tax=Paenibacillus sp. 2TAB19 TaxID=3233003 RepID=UPI003F9D3107
MNKMYKVLATASIMALAAVPLTASAQDIPPASIHTGQGQILNQANVVPAVWGQITDFINDSSGKFITVKGRGLAINDQSEMILNITKDTKIYNAKGKTVALKTIIDNKMVVKAFYGPNITKSLPARGTALTLVVQDNSFTGIEGTVGEMRDNGIVVTGTNIYSASEETVVLHFADNVQIFDQNGQAIKAEVIQPGMSVKSIYGPAMTKSIPPQSTTKYVVVNTVIEEQTPPGTDGIITNITGKQVTVMGNSLEQGGVNYVILTVDEQTEIVNEKGEKLTADALKQDARVEAYYGEVMTMIYPAQTHADKLVVKAAQTHKVEGTIAASDRVGKDQVYVNVGSDDSTANDIILNIGEATRVIYPVGIDTGLIAGSKIVAYHAAEMTDSLPGMTNAELVIVTSDIAEDESE